MLVNSEQALIKYARSRNGEPVITVNTAPVQDSIAVDHALQLFREFHMDSTYTTFLGADLTQTDITNGYVTLSPDVQTVKRVLPINGGSGFIFSRNPFSNLRYQFTLQNFQSGTGLFSPGGGGFLSYHSQVMQYIETLNFQFRENPQIDFARHSGRLYIHGKFADELIAGDSIVAEVEVTVLAEDNPSNNGNPNGNIYNNLWIKDYTTTLIAEQWGRNLSKFGNIQAVGGVTVNGEKILADALAEKQRLYDLLRSTYEAPPMMQIG